MLVLTPLCWYIVSLLRRFPRMGPQVHLRMPVLKKDKSVRIEFMAFGGGWVDQILKTAMETNPHTGGCSYCLGRGLYPQQ